MNAVVGCEEVVDLNNNSGDLDALNGQPNLQRESFATSEKQEGPVATLEEQESVSNLKKIGADFSIPLSIFHYKGYGSDFFTSWYNISSEIFKEINRACLEKKVLNSALSVLMFPYVASVALGLVIYKTNSKTQTSSEESKTKKSEVSTAKRLAYGVLAAIAIPVNIAVLIALIIPATPALATFYLTNRKLSHSLVAALKISNGLYQNEHQNIEVSFREIDAGKSDIKWDMEVKFPPQFEQLLRDLYEDKDGSWFNVARDSEHNTILKLSANINLKNGLRPLRNEIGSMLAISIQEFAKTMEELMKLEKKDITYDKLKELLNEFRLKVVDSVDSKLISHLIQDAHRVAFIQAIKIAQKRKEDFSLEGALRDILVKQELESQGKELPSEKEIIIRDLKELKRKEALDLADEDDRLESLAKIGDITSDTNDDALPMFKAKWKQLIKEGKMAEKTIISVYRDIHPQATEEVLGSVEEEIECLKKIGQTRYDKICKKLQEMYENRRDGNLKDGALKRKLEDLFKFEYDGQKVEERLIESRIRTIQTLLNKSDNKIKQSLAEDLSELNETRTSDKVNDFVKKMYLEIIRCRIQELFEKQGKSIKNVEDNKDMLFNGEDEKRLVNKIVSYRKEIGEYFTQPTRLKEIIGKQNKDLDVEKNSNEKESSSIELIELCLKNNQEILEALEQLELKKEGLLINEETKNDYKEELTSRERIKFAIIEDDLLKVFKLETFDKEAIKKLLEQAELEYCLAERCIKYPVIKTKDNIKHFCQDLLSPLIDRLVENVLNNVPKDNESGLWKIWNSLKVGFNYNVIGWSATVNKDNSTEGKALSVAHDTHKEVETFLQRFESNYEKAGAFLGDLFSDDGETFKNDVWPKVEEHLRGMWDRFFKDIEFNIGNRLDEVNVTQQNQKTLVTV